MSTDSDQIDRIEPVDLDVRKATILRTIVADYIASGEPVGSALVAGRSGLEVSPATIRNEMKALEADGFIVQPHTSAGRVPTERGYRWFVDNVDLDHIDDTEQRRTLRRLLEDARDADDLLRRAMAALAELTSLVALIVAPGLPAARIKLFNLVLLDTHRVLVVIADDTGHVINRTVELPDAVTGDDLAHLERRLADAVVESRARDVAEALRAQRQELARHAAVIDAIADAISDDVAPPVMRDVLVSGRDALVGANVSPERLQGLLRLLDDSSRVADVLVNTSSESLQVRIGNELESPELATASMVGQRVAAEGSVGVLGPVRMDYVRAVASVRAVANELTRLLGTDQPGADQPQRDAS